MVGEIRCKVLTVVYLFPACDTMNVKDQSSTPKPLSSRSDGDFYAHRFIRKSGIEAIIERESTSRALEGGRLFSKKLTPILVRSSA